MKTKQTMLLTVLTLAASASMSLAQTPVVTNEPVATPTAEVINTTAEVTNTTAEVTTTTAESNNTAAVFTPINDPVVLAPQSLADTNASDEIVPLVQIDDAPLADAIKTLARQAGINFQFDPRVLNPPPDATGKVPAQPAVSFRWENVTALEALLALLENYNLQMIKDPKTKIARITVKDAAALEPLVTRVFQLDYSSPTNMASIVTNTISARSRVVADVRTSQLVISATERELDAVQDLIHRLDTITKQILIEARFLEINKNPRTSKGIDWTDTLAAQRVTFGNTSAHPVAPQRSFDKGQDLTGIVPSGGPGAPGIIASTAAGFGPVGFLNAQGASVVLSFLNNDADAESIATPRAVTLENVQTELSVVRNIPVFIEQQGANTGGSVQANTVRPEYNLPGPNGSVLNEVGIKLFVTPRIYGSSNVFLDLKPEISDREARPETTILSDKVSSAPIFSRRKLQTQAMIPSGYTLVLGGLRQDNSSKTHTKVPILGDLPGIGLLFRKDEKSRDKRDLVIFVTPTIIKADDFQHAPEAREFLQKKFVETPEKEWSAWDSGKPKDWSKPKEDGSKEPAGF
ncbi:MAG: secretin N-terminal domain-containing protein [Verrucomicrobiota bacterium]